MKAVGVIGPDFEPRLFDIDEPTPARDGIVVKVLASSVNEFAGITTDTRTGRLPFCWGETSLDGWRPLARTWTTSTSACMWPAP